MFLKRIALVSFMFVLVSAQPSYRQGNSRTLRVVHHEHYPPFEFLDISNESNGFDVEIFKAIAEAANLDYQLSGVPWDSVSSFVHSRNFDVLTGMYYTHTRDAELDFSIPIYTVSYTLFVHKGSSIDDLHSSTVKDVIIVGGGVSERLVDDVYSIREVIKVRFIEEALDLLERGAYDCALLPSIQGSYYMKQRGLRNVISVGPKLISRNLCIAVPAGEVGLLNRINQGLLQIKAKGRYDQIVRKWMEPFEETFISWRTLQPIIIGVSILMIMIIIAVTLWTRTMKMAVRRTTRNLRMEINERKQAEATLKVTSEELLESNTLKELLIDIVTHDLKNPAGIIKNMTSMLEGNESNREIINMLRDSSTSLLKVIANAEVLANVVIGDEVEKVDLDLTAVFREVLRGFELVLSQKEIRLENNLPPNLRVRANPIISEVFTNYLSNAVKYSAEGKRLIINAQQDKAFVSVHVIDFGQTIPADDRKAIFRRSVQLERGAKSKGRGLGLAIVARIAEIHGGTAGVEPNLPTGNNFYFTLPVSRI